MPRYHCALRRRQEAGEKKEEQHRLQTKLGSDIVEWYFCFIYEVKSAPSLIKNILDIQNMGAANTAAPRFFFLLTLLCYVGVDVRSFSVPRSWEERVTSVNDPVTTG